MLDDLLKGLTSFQTRLKGRSSVNVNDVQTKADARALATAYFEIFRPRVLQVLGDSLDPTDLDSTWQELVRLAHGNNSRKTYLKLAKKLTTLLKDASVRALSRTAERPSVSTSLSDLTPAELQVVSTLEALLPTAAASYRQGLLDLRSSTRLSYRGTASEFREALRETLDHLAPDADVASQPGFSTEPGQTKPSMKQKTRFVLLSRGRSRTQAGVTEKTIGLVEGLAGEVVRATYDRASLATHLEATRAEVLRIKRYVDTVFFDLLEIADADHEGRSPQ